MANKIQWLGHSTFLIQTSQGKHILIDPWVYQNPACPESAKNLEKIDLMLITHGHFDHCADAEELAQKYNPTIVAIFEIGSYLEQKNVQNVSPMNKGGSQTIHNIQITMTHAFHSSGIGLNQAIVEGGEAAGFVVKLEDGFTFYHAGDTCLFGDMTWIAKLYQPQLAMLPIGDRFTMGPKEAAYAAQLLQTPKVIPMHFGTFPLLTGTTEEFQQALQKISPNTQLIQFQPGEIKEF
ncbi:MAG: metal-dependent hydrolase [Planctomycetota bacterium]|nr:MAG: metal-dependent hydrolase [Planctomycetota bacterium]